MEKKSIEDILLARNLVTKDELEEARKEAKDKSITVAKMLISKGIINGEDYAEALSELLGVPYIDLANYLIDPETLKCIPEAVARKLVAVPLFKIQETLSVAMTDPKDIMVIDELARRCKCEIEPLLSTKNGILLAIDQYYGVTGSVNEVIKDIDKGFKKDKKILKEFPEGALEVAEEAPVIKLVNLIIMEAIKGGASDIHIEPEENALKVRFRVDGILHEMFSPPKHLEPAIISRVKVLSKIDIAEKRKPQDGRFNIKVENRDVDFRVSTFPTIYGENIVIRILDKTKVLLELDKLGFSENTQRDFEGLIKRPHGIILVTGPTGSGKTTTLYSALSSIDSQEKNIITVEDPVEYHIGRVRQSQINPKAGLTFATGLRSILRQDPDIIMVGEIRDKETAEISIQAALTGHLVFSTLHTNDASGALSRLIDMGIEPFLISSSVIGILAQRLVRKVCEKCKESYQLSSVSYQELKAEGRNLTAYKGKGCNVCRNTGYKGRIGIFELLLVNEGIKKMLVENSASDAIKKKAIGQGMKTLRDDGFDKVVKGITTLDEVIKATQEE